MAIDFYEYASFGGGHEITLPFSLDGDYMLTVDFQMTTYINDQHVIGNSYSETRIHLTEFSNKWYTSSGTAEVNFMPTDFPLTDRHIFVSNKNGKNLMDGVEVSNYTPTTESTVYYRVGGRQGSSWNFRGNIWSFRLEKISDGTIICNLRPAKDSSHEGLYDVVNDTWYTGGITVHNIIIPTSYLIESGGDYYTISGGVLTNVGSTLNAQLFYDYGMASIPDWSDYSSLPSPSVLCWDQNTEQSMTATTSGVPSSTQAVISQNVPTGDGVQSVTIVSDNDTLYSVSFDNGLTWWKYASGAWSQVSSISDGMTKSEVEGISANAWSDKNTGLVKFRFTLLDENCYVTSIRVDYSGDSGVVDVEVNGTSVVNAQGVAEVSVPTATSDLTNDSGYLTSSDVGTAAAKDYITSVTQNSGDLVTSGAVWTAIDNLPEPMIFKGTLGTGGTISVLPAASSANQGYTYKVITDGTYASQSAKVGDVFVSNGSEWVLIPSGDETVSDTWRNIKVNGTEKLGNSISTGAVDFVDGTNTNASFDANGNKITVDVSTVFTEASTRSNIASGETIATILGKIKKFFSDLKTVAFTGAYADLTGQPTIPTDFVPASTGGRFRGKVTVNQGKDTETTAQESALILGGNIADGNLGASYGVLGIYGKGTKMARIFADNITSTQRDFQLPDNGGTLALTSDLPTVNNATLTLKHNGSTLGTFTANASSNKTITIPNDAIKFYKGALLHGSSASTAIFGYGVAQITLSGGVARIDFELKITTGDSSSTKFDYGIDTDYLTATAGKSITPTAGGVVHFFTSSGAIDTTHEELAGTAVLNGSYPTFWLLARMYNQNGSIGQWPTSAFPANSRVTGTIFGTYS